MNPIAFKSALFPLAALLLGLWGAWSQSAGAVVLTEGQIKDKVVAHVQEKVAQVVDPADVKNIHVSIIRVPAAPFDFPAAKTLEEIKVSLTSRLGETYSPRGIVQVSLQDGQGHQREIGVPVHIIIQKPVWVVKNVVNAHEPLRAADFSLQSKEVSNIYSYAVGANRNLGSYQARVNLRPGDILDARKIVIPPDVTYNSPVRIFISNGDGMTVTVPGIALANGKIGETIRVRQAVFQRKDYSAKIVDKNKVLVEI
jgi:flagella basal body P-ring formation protein FlgA